MPYTDEQEWLLWWVELFALDPLFVLERKSLARILWGLGSSPDDAWVALRTYVSPVAVEAQRFALACIFGAPQPPLDLSFLEASRRLLEPARDLT